MEAAACRLRIMNTIGESSFAKLIGIGKNFRGLTKNVPF